MNLVHEYDRWHERLIAANPQYKDETSPWYTLVFEHLVPVAGKQVLEVGCGRGGFAHLLASEGAKVCGTDFSSSALAAATARSQRNKVAGGSIYFAQADTQHLPFEDQAFDIVISCEVIEHLPDPVVALREMARVCRSGGLLYLTTPNYLNLIGLYELYATIFKKNLHSDFFQPLDRHYLLFQIRRFLRTAGWQILDSDGTVHQVPVPGRDPVTLRFVEGNRAVRRWLRPLALHYLLVGQKQRSG